MLINNQSLNYIYMCILAAHNFNYKPKLNITLHMHDEMKKKIYICVYKREINGELNFFTHTHTHVYLPDYEILNYER